MEPQASQRRGETNKLVQRRFERDAFAIEATGARHDHVRAGGGHFSDILERRVAVHLDQRRDLEPAGHFLQLGDALDRAREHFLAGVARQVGMSACHFCKRFRKVTGVNFTRYVSCVRVEKAKNLLLNPNSRVSEIAFEVGFQSLTNFNRRFKNMAGQSPTEYRRRLSTSLSARKRVKMDNRGN